MLIETLSQMLVLLYLEMMECPDGSTGQVTFLEDVLELADCLHYNI